MFQNNASYLQYGNKQPTSVSTNAYWIWDDSNTQEIVILVVIRELGLLILNGVIDENLFNFELQDSNGLTKASNKMRDINITWESCKERKLLAYANRNDYLIIDAANNKSDPNMYWGFFIRAYVIIKRSGFDDTIIYFSELNTECGKIQAAYNSNDENFSFATNPYPKTFIKPIKKTNIGSSTCGGMTLGDSLWNSDKPQFIRCRVKLSLLKEKYDCF